MAQSTAILTYDAVGNREDLTNDVVMVAPEETPLWSTSRKVKATARLHEWQNDTLAAAADNANIEGADFSFSKPDARSRVSNPTQIFTKEVEVSDTQQEVDIAGVAEEMAYQMEKRMKELATDIEKAAFTGTGNTGASGTARRLTGLYAAVTSVSTTGTGTGSEALTEDMFNDTLQSIYDNGGRPNAAYVNSFQKRQISLFSTPNTRFLDTVSDGRLVNFVDVYESDFGVISIRLDQFADTDKVLIATSDQIAFAILRPIREVEVAKVGDASRAALVGELTLQWGNQEAHGEILQLSTS